MQDSENIQEIPQRQERDNLDYSHIYAALDLVRVPESLKEEIDKAHDDTCFKACAHGTIHRFVEENKLPSLAAAYLLKELAKDTDPFDLSFKEGTGGKRLRLAEQTMDPHKCFDVCFEDLPEVQRKGIIKGALMEIYTAEQEEALEEDLLHQLIAERIGVVEASKKYPNRPFLMARLASEQGEEGYRQLRIVYPQIPGYPDPEEVAKWLAGKGPEPERPQQSYTQF